MTNDLGKSDRAVVPTKPPNEAGRPAEEAVEGRALAKGNLREQNASRTQRRTDAPSALERVRQAARRDKGMRFTALLHHVYDLDRLRPALAQRRRRKEAALVEVTFERLGTCAAIGRARRTIGSHEVRNRRAPSNVRPRRPTKLLDEESFVRSTIVKQRAVVKCPFRPRRRRCDRSVEAPATLRGRDRRRGAERAFSSRRLPSTWTPGKSSRIVTFSSSVISRRPQGCPSRRSR